MAHLTRRNVLHAAGVTGMIASSRRSAQAGASGARLLRVGFQKGEPILLAAKQNRSLETLLNPLDIEVQWIEFQFGPPMLEAMRVNSVDIGAVGDTPPVFAQAAHGDLLYIAAQRSGGQAILVPPGSTLQTLHDLKGRKVAFGRASSAHNLTLAALEKAGLNYDDIQPIYLGPADAGAAFERGAIDAWTIWDPYYALFETRPGVRTLALWTDITEQNSFFMSRRAYVEANEQIVARIIGEFGRIAEWARAHRPDLAGLLAAGTGMPLDAVQRGVDRAPFLVLPDERRTRPQPAEGRRPLSWPRPDPDRDQGKRADLASRRMNRVLPWLMPIAVLLLWQVGSNLGVIEAGILPAPLAVAEAGWRVTRSGELWTSIEVSTWRALAGFAIGGGIGFALGMMNGLSSLSETLTDSTLQMVRNIPHLALIPLVILWFGIDEAAKVFLVALGVFFPIYVNTLHGVRSVDPHLLEMAHAYGMKPNAGFGASCCQARCRRSSSACAKSRHHVADTIVAETIATSGIAMAMNAASRLQRVEQRNADFAGRA
jgi:NitT/TauT family transport system substrate-binding protein/sulfonate transport system substrate-binding protein